MESEALKKIYPWPERLYKFRGLGGVAEYRHTGNGTYQDATCRDHEPCQITVQPVDDHFEPDVLANESAVKFAEFHRPYDCPLPHLYTDETPVLRCVLEFQLEHHRKKVDEYATEMARMLTELSTMKPKELLPQTISRLDYGDEIILLPTLLNQKRYETRTVKYKVFTKDGVDYLMTGDGMTIRDKCDDMFLDVQYGYYDDDREQWTEGSYLGFCSIDDYKAYCHNDSIKEKERSVNCYKSSIKHYQELIAEKKDKLKELDGK